MRIVEYKIDCHSEIWTVRKRHLLFFYKVIYRGNDYEKALQSIREDKIKGRKTARLLIKI